MFMVDRNYCANHPRVLHGLELSTKTEARPDARSYRGGLSRSILEGDDSGQRCAASCSGFVLGIDDTKLIVDAKLSLAVDSVGFEGWGEI